MQPGIAGEVEAVEFCRSDRARDRRNSQRQICGGEPGAQIAGRYGQRIASLPLPDEAPGVDRTGQLVRTQEGPRLARGDRTVLVLSKRDEPGG